MHPIAVLIETGDTAVMDLVDELCKPLPIKKNRFLPDDGVKSLDAQLVYEG